MSLLDKASLIITPNAYKESKLYSVIPSNGDGDMTVVRATTATRVNEAGLIEVVPKNLLTYSEEFDNASWVKDGVSLTTNATISPNGTTTADLITESATLGSHRVYKIISIFGNGSFSFFVKSNGVQWIAIAAGNTSSFGVYSFFDIINGTLGVSTIGTSKIEDYGNGWYRCSVNGIGNGGGTSGNIYLAESNGVNSYTGNGVDGIYIWGAQLEAGSTATSYFPTTDRLNIPRIDYTGGGCPSILVEPQRTNLLLQSEDISSASWTKNAVSITANNTTSPDGTTNADLITADGTNTQHYVLQGQASSAKTISFFVKMGTQRYVQILTGGSANALANYDLQTGEVGGLGSASTGSMVDYGNSWWRIVLTSSDAVTSSVYLCFVNSLIQGRFPSTTSTGTIWIWGAMAENGATYPTSYIPTVASSVTRNADVISKTGISDLINSEEGVLYAEIATLVNTLTVDNSITLTDGGNNKLIFRYRSTNSFNVKVFVNGVSQAEANHTLSNSTNFNKIAIKWKLNDYEIYVNGISIFTDTNALVFPNNSINTLSFSDGLSTPFYGKVQNLMVFPSALSDTELIALTTL